MTKMKSDIEHSQRKNKVWTKEKIVQLIRLYRGHECLWNNYIEAYKHKDKRNEAIKQICTELRITKFDFGKKIHNLRNQFNAEMKKLDRRIEESGGAGDGNSFDGGAFRSHWDHYESLKFLKKVIAPRPCYQNSSSFQQLRFKQQTPSDDEDARTRVPRAEHYDTINTSEQTNATTSAAAGTDDDEAADFHFVEADEDDDDEEILTEIAETVDRKFDPSSMREVIITTLPANSTEDGIGKQTGGSTYFTAVHHLGNNAQAHTRVVASRPIQAQQNKPNSTSNTFTTQSIQSQDQMILSTSEAGTASPTLKRPRRLSVSTSTGAIAVVRDQWDTFGEMVATEFRNLNSDLSRKKLKRKIMHAMLEVGEEDDGININIAIN